ncbi:MAG: hypothetical protein GX300_09070 [Tissierellia bacterium]|nr:hypothetical protein [Tissierellia bacterium]
MERIFLQIINMSITSTYVILFIILARLFLKRAPKIFSYGLWGIAFFRLVFPFFFESIFSLVSINTRTIPENIAYTPLPQIQSGVRVIDGAVNRVLPTPPPIEASINPIQVWISIGSIIWLIGLIILLAYSILTTLRLSRSLKSASHYYGNIYLADSIGSPFVFGLIKPKIYLPRNLSKTEEPYIIKHEETHIKRKDHIIKFIGFLIMSIHWFNPMAWLAFQLMVEDMEKSCDESVIRELGYGIKKDYSNSLLSLSLGRRTIGGSPIAFGENNTKGRIKNILNYKKPKFWVTILALIAIIVLGVGLLSNPPDKDVHIGDERDLGKSIEDFAWEYIDNQIQILEKAEWGDFKIVDKEITRLEKLFTIEDILPNPVELWKLEYRLRPESMEGVVIAGGMYIEDGWLLDEGPSGNPYLAFSYENDNLVYLGNVDRLESSLDTPELAALAIRRLLEDKGVLPNETYEGDHVVIKFPLSTGETSQLLLSQPLVQGDSGIWAVERWMDGNGNVYLAYQDLEADMAIEEYYRNLQIESDQNAKPWLTDPVEVAYDYIINILGQVLVKKDDLQVINPATIDDFNESPESHYIGYITMMTLEERIFHLDRVEFLTLEDEERISELNLDKDYHMPSGFYVYNPDNYPTSLDVSEDTIYLILDWSDISKHKSLSKKEFVEYNNSIEYTPLYHVYTKDGFVTRIEEQYIP